MAMLNTVVYCTSIALEKKGGYSLPRQGSSEMSQVSACIPDSIRLRNGEEHGTRNRITEAGERQYLSCFIYLALFISFTHLAGGRPELETTINRCFLLIKLDIKHCLGKRTP